MKAWHIGELSPCIISRLKVTEQHHSEDEVQNGTLGTFELLLLLLPKSLYIKPNIYNHSKHLMMPCTRLFICFALIKLCSKTNNLRSLVQEFE